jgi:hypothetical protein
VSTATPVQQDLVPVPRDGLLPVSATQEERLATGRHTQFVNQKIAAGVVFEGPVDVAALERAVVAVTARHESVRAVFPVGTGGHHMRILSELRDPLRFESVEDRPEQERMDAALARLVEYACEPFDLEHGPMFRAMLVRLDEHRHALGMTTDHIVIDAWSVRLMINDLLELYRSLVTGEQARLPELTVQYPDYVVWQHSQLQGKMLERMVGYWRRKLDGIDPIPASGLSDPGGEPGGEPRLIKQKAVLDPVFTTKMDAFAEAERTSPTGVIGLAVKAAARTRRLATMDPEQAGDVALFGSLANRTRPEVEHVVGYFATPATFRTFVDGAMSFREAVGHSGRTFWEAMRHQRIPHSLIMKELGSPQYGSRFRDPAGLPSYLGFDLLDYTDTDLPAPPGVTVRRVAMPMPEVPRGGLRVVGFRRGDELTLELRYRSDRFSGGWAESFMTDVRRVLEVGLADPDTTIDRAIGDAP